MTGSFSGALAVVARESRSVHLGDTDGAIPRAVASIEGANAVAVETLREELDRLKKIQWIKTFALIAGLMSMLVALVASVSGQNQLVSVTAAVIAGLNGIVFALVRQTGAAESRIRSQIEIVRSTYALLVIADYCATSKDKNTADTVMADLTRGLLAASQKGT